MFLSHSLECDIVRYISGGPDQGSPVGMLSNVSRHSQFSYKELTIEPAKHLSLHNNQYQQTHSRSKNSKHSFPQPPSNQPKTKPQHSKLTKFILSPPQHHEALPHQHHCHPSLQSDRSRKSNRATLRRIPGPRAKTFSLLLQGNR